MFARCTMLLLTLGLGLTACRSVPSPAPEERPPALDAAEATAALDLLAVLAKGEEPKASAWEALYATEGYRALKRREEKMKHPFTDQEFAEFLRRPETVARLPQLRATLAAWTARGVERSLAFARAYLPEGTPIRAKVFVMVKPRTNSFVFEHNQIFVYLNPESTAEQVENLVAHEFHHIGLGAACKDQADGATAGPAMARMFSGALGEGVAMLAAAGGPAQHPHAVSRPEDRARWDRDLSRHEEDLRAVDTFLLDLAEARITDEDRAMEVAAPFWGEQGPWYTVGWWVSSTVERALGRPRLVADLCDPAALFEDYGRVAPAGAARFSPALVKQLRK